MRIQTECISFEYRWMISSSFDFQAHQQHSQRRCYSQTALQWFNVLPGAPRCTWRPLHRSSKLWERYACNATHHLGDGKHVILSHMVRGSVRAVRAVRNTWVFLMETRVVADETRLVFSLTHWTGPNPQQIQAVPPASLGWGWIVSSFFRWLWWDGRYHGWHWHHVRLISLDG